MIYLSASSIKDIWQCRRRWYYRTNFKERAVPNEYMIFGGIVHKAIEKMWRGELIAGEPAINWCESEWYKQENDAFFLDDPPKKFHVYVNGFDKIHNAELSSFSKDGALVEHFFKFPYKENIMIVGKMDLILDNIIFDWKTTYKKPSQYDLGDFQFLLYEWAYREMFGKKPAGNFYGHLAGGKLYDVNRPEALVETVPEILDRTIEMVYNETEDGNWPRWTGSHCDWCVYKGICWNELNS